MKLKLRRASNSPMNEVIKEVEINTIEDLIALEKKEKHPIILGCFLSDEDNEYSLLVYDDYIEWCSLFLDVIRLNLSKQICKKVLTNVALCGIIYTQRKRGKYHGNYNTCTYIVGGCWIFWQFPPKQKGRGQEEWKR